MRILGIDPGSRVTGFAVIEKEGRGFRYVTSGILRFDKEKEFLDRLGHIYDSCKELIKTLAPDQIAIESLIYVKSVTSLAKLSQARGAMIAAFMQSHKSKVFEYSPNLVKSTVTGHGHATKDGVDKTLSMIFGEGLPKSFKSHDESDAIAIALCHGILGGLQSGPAKTRTKGRSLKSALAHLG